MQCFAYAAMLVSWRQQVAWVELCDLQNGSRIEHRLVHIDRPIMRIPNIAIHLQRDMNDKFEFNKENQLWVGL